MYLLFNSTVVSHSIIYCLYFLFIHLLTSNLTFSESYFLREYIVLVEHSLNTTFTHDTFHYHIWFLFSFSVTVCLIFQNAHLFQELSYRHWNHFITDSWWTATSMKWEHRAVITCLNSFFFFVIKTSSGNFSACLVNIFQEWITVDRMRLIEVIVEWFTGHNWFLDTVGRYWMNNCQLSFHCSGSIWFSLYVSSARKHQNFVHCFQEWIQWVPNKICDF